MSNTKPTMSLRDQITAHLASAGEATQAQIAKAVGMADFPSRVIKELNAMRTDALLEAERKGKGPELTYWLAVATPQDRRPEPPSPAATSAGIAEPSRGKQERRTALQSLIKGRTLADAIATRDAAATLGCTPEGVLWILRHEEAAGRAKRLREKAGKRGSWIYDPRTIQHTQPAEVQITGSSASALTPLSEGAAVQPNPAPVQPADVSPAAPVAADDMQDDDEMPPADASLLALANRELANRLARVAHVLRGSGLEGLKDLDDGADLQSAAAALTGAYQMALAELRACAGKIADLQHSVSMQNAEMFKQAVDVIDLRCQLEALQHEAMRGATLLSGDDRYTAAGYLVRAPKRKPRITTTQETAVAAALAAARNGSGRGEVFALVPVGKAVRGAEWRPA